MTQKIVVQDREWEREENRLKYCTELEKGNLLFFPEVPFDFPKNEIEFLLAQKQGSSKTRKNIAYKPGLDRITNHETKDPLEAEKLKGILRSYSNRVTTFLSLLLSPYAKYWRHDYASFRPFQEKGRGLRLRARNDLLHVDAFPTRPLHGARILRFFTNINPIENRVWNTSNGFEELLKQFGKEIPQSNYKILRRIFRPLGMKWALRSPYDSFMLRFHNYLKENSAFQEQCSKTRWEFPPLSCWAVFTDQVSHAALQGQYALEQTLIIPQKGLLTPEKSPLRLLEREFNKQFV